MKYLPSFILGLILLGVWSCSDMGNPIVGDCLESQLDCLGECNGTAIVDVCGECAGLGLNEDGCCGNAASCVHYSDEIQPIFSNNCGSCHISSSTAGLNLATYDNVMAGSDGPVIISGDGAGSLIIQKLRGTDLPRMPYGGPYLDEAIINLIETWIDEGALEN